MEESKQLGQSKTMLEGTLLNLKKKFILWNCFKNMDLPLTSHQTKNKRQCSQVEARILERFLFCTRLS